MEELGYGEDKVEHLWDEEQEHRLAEVSENGDDGKRHPSKVTECVADEHLCRIPNNASTV